MQSQSDAPRFVGRYMLFDEIAVGGMASVHLGRLIGAVGFARTVAIKRLHPQFSKDPEFAAMFLDEARLAARIAHPNVVATIDVVTDAEELLLVMEYVRGESMGRLLDAATKTKTPPSPRITTRIVSDVLYGLHAAHDATTEDHQDLHIVHRDISPQNILVGVDGISRVVDFGIAKATVRAQHTGEGTVRGKIRYMAPEQLLQSRDIDRRADVFSAAVVLWQALTGQKLFDKDELGALVDQVLHGKIVAPSTVVPGLPKELDEVVLKGLERERDWRFPTARDMAVALEKALPPATAAEVGAWVEQTVPEVLRDRAQRVSKIERLSSDVISSRPEITGQFAAGSGIVRMAPASLPELDGVDEETMGAEDLSASLSGPVAPLFAPVLQTSGPSRWPLGLGAAAVIAVVLGVVVWRLTAGHAGQSVSPVSSAAESSSLPATAATEAASTRPGTAATDTAASAQAVASASPSATTTGRSHVPRGTRPAVSHEKTASPPPPPPPPPQTKPKPNCDPPFLIDKDGYRKLKPECL